jgi:hypothetical protein
MISKKCTQKMVWRKNGIFWDFNWQKIGQVLDFHGPSKFYAAHRNYEILSISLVPTFHSTNQDKKIVIELNSPTANIL